MGFDELLEDISSLDNAQVEERGKSLYRELYLNKGEIGIIHMYGGEEVTFHEDRYTHAFRTSPDRRKNPYGKSMVSRERIERIRWIGEILAGHIPGTSGFLVHDKDRPIFNYLIVWWKKLYVIWLAPTKKGGWKFSSAYLTSRNDIERYTKTGRKIWDLPDNENAP